MSPLPKGGDVVTRALVKRKVPKNTSEMLQHQDAECGYDPSAVAAAPAKRKLVTTKITSLNRMEGEPLGLTIDENLVVTNVVEGTVAHRAGLRAGTKLSTVDGQRVATQDDAIDALRNSRGDSVRVGLQNGGSSQSMKQEGVVAGIQTNYEKGNRRTKRADPTKDISRDAPFAGNPIPTPIPRPVGLGPPGLGPQAEPWGETSAIAESPMGYDSFKPNTYIPERLQGTPVRKHSNMTSYEVAETRGEVTPNGEWEAPTTEKYRSGKVQMKDRVERKNGDILVNNMTEGPMTPRRGRGPSPSAFRSPAAGPPMGDELAKAQGKRCETTGGLNPELLSFPMKREQQGGSISVSERRAMTPTRYRNTPEGHGDIIGATYGRGDKPSPRGRMQTTSHDFLLPKVRPRSFTPTARHQVASPAPSDIFNTGTDTGTCKDVRDHRRSSQARGLSPRNVSSVNLTHQTAPSPMTPRTPNYDASTPRRGRGCGSMAPALPHSGYTPWGDRE
eukprot:TRINITY_DN731_c1_g1_i1.p1 TRINITY_DN731_c1_g1~~TRINITY_DN731_c1_g1_i1.p1  ORF type:complete len:502 (+),score=112.91 TRINITY_DN731_c1_g1_i1:343-1848(+)